MIDTHAHLDALEDPGAAIERARAAGVTRVITIGTGIESCRAALAIAEAHAGVYAALGIDPHQASSPQAGRIDELRALLEHPKAVAIGETGLDNFHRHAAPAEQRSLLDAHVGLAAERGLPLVIHSREASRATAEALSTFGGRVVLHCFSEPELLPIALERGYYVSFAGNVTFAKAGELRAAAVQVAPDRILAETDSPYLAPEPLRGRPNEPANVVHTVAVLAAARDEHADELRDRIDANATAVFGLP